MGAGRMADVQLDDVGAPAAPERARRAGTVLRRWWPLPVAAVLAVVGWQVAADARTEATADRLRATPGVIATTVTPPLDGTATATPELASALPGAVHTQSGLLAAPVDGGRSDPLRVVGIDPAVGEEVWSVDVADPPPPGLSDRAVACDAGTDGPARSLWCVVTDYRGASGAAAATRLVEVHLGDHAVRTDRDLDPGASVVVVGGTLVVGTPGEAGVRLVATDVRTGEQVWAADLPDPPAPGVGWLSRAGGHVLASAVGATWAVDAGTGGVLAGGAGVAVVRGDRVVDLQGSSRTLLLGTDGSRTGAADGQVQGLAPDDGSAPDVLLVEVADGTLQRLLRGVDARSGAVLWERPSDGMAPTNRLLLDGVVYGSGGSTLWAVDAVTGEERWTTEGGVLADHRLMTDGVHLLRAERDPDSGAPVLAAYALGSGRRAWSTPLPPGVDTVWTQGGILYGRGDDGA
ncbi:PQQ-binding-like beta-propeller repeat protein, partial [Cellulomonas sp. IC4_254]|uniref:outer membrane protein assembly factor BamB family protein n=1 Tax=Cellulomonas sp. IC4_254 TaxID=2714040 RepID=UPI0014227FFB